MKHYILLPISIFLISAISAFSQEITNDSLGILVKDGSYFGQPNPGNTPIIFAPDILIRSKQAHSNIVFSKEGDQAYWCYNGIWFSKIKDGKWTKPKLLPFSKEEYSDDAPFISPDGKSLFFTSKRPLHINDTSKKENIWMVDLKDENWSEPRPLPSVINNMFQHWQFSVDLVGNIYFKHTTSQNNSRNSDIFCSKLKSGVYQIPERLGKKINSNVHENNPFISPKGDFLIFTRIKDKKPMNGGLFISFKQSDNSWTEAIPLNEHIDFRYSGNCAIMTQDTRYLFFLDTYKGDWQRYWVSASFIDKLRSDQ